MIQTFKRYWPYIKSYKAYFFVVFIGILMTVSATLATAEIMKYIMDDMFIERNEDMIIYIPLGIIIIYTINSVGRYIQSVSMNIIGLSILSTLREVLLEKIVYQDMMFLYKNRSGELISRITNDINRVNYFVSNMMPELFREALTVVGIISYVIYLNPSLAFYSLVVLPVAIYPLILIAKRLKKLSHRSQEKNADLVSRLTEVFNNTEIIKANATEEFELNRFSKENQNFLHVNIKSVYMTQLVSPMMEIIGASGLAAVLYMGSKEVLIVESITPGEFLSFFTAVGLVFQPIRRIGSIYGKIQDALAASERVFSVLDTPIEIKDGIVQLEDKISSIIFKGVALHYDEKVALKNITIDFKTDRHIALVGDSGGGKSSLINLLLRFYDVSEGAILINGKNIKEYNQASLRHQISLVSQRVYIFADTLASNVAYGEEMDEIRVREALQRADATAFVESLDDGIYTLMDEFGINLSGGQRQRIAIARAIYKHSSLLLLDEATSALDNESEKRIQEALEAYSEDKITITIAHRLSTVEGADRILVFNQGEIVASGSHVELLEHSKEYQQLSGTLV